MLAGQRDRGSERGRRRRRTTEQLLLLIDVFWLTNRHICCSNRSLWVQGGGEVLCWRRRGWSLRLALWGLANRWADRSWYISKFVWDTWDPRKRKPTRARLPVISELPEGVVSTEERSGFFFVGRWIPNKGLRLLLDAYKAAKLDKEQWPLRVAGDGPLREEVLNKISEEKIEGVETLGFVSEEKRKELTRRTKWMVTPPNTNEDLGLTPLEARSVGVPCIVTNDGGLRETGGQDALRCEPGDLQGLTHLLETAAKMPELEYINRSQQTKEELSNYLEPLSRYGEEYRKPVSYTHLTLPTNREV